MSVFIAIVLVLAAIARRVKGKLLKNVYLNTGVVLTFPKGRSALMSLGILIPFVAFLIAERGYGFLLLRRVFGLPLFCYLFFGLALLAFYSKDHIKQTEISSGIVLTLVQAFDGILTMLGFVLHMLASIIFSLGAGGHTPTNTRKPDDAMKPACLLSDEIAWRHGFQNADDAYSHGYDSYTTGDSRSYTNFGDQNTKLY